MAEELRSASTQMGIGDEEEEQQEQKTDEEQEEEKTDEDSGDEEGGGEEEDGQPSERERKVDNRHIPYKVFRKANERAKLAETKLKEFGWAIDLDNLARTNPEAALAQMQQIQEAFAKQHGIDISKGRKSKSDNQEEDLDESEMTEADKRNMRAIQRMESELKELQKATNALHGNFSGSEQARAEQALEIAMDDLRGKYGDFDEETELAILDMMEQGGIADPEHAARIVLFDKAKELGAKNVANGFNQRRRRSVVSSRSTGTREQRESPIVSARDAAQRAFQQAKKSASDQLGIR